MRAGRADAQALRRARSRSRSARSLRSSASTSAAVRQTGVAISSTDCMSSGPICSTNSLACDGREDRVDVLDEVERLRVEEHVLLLDAERVRVARAERVVEHAPARGEALTGDRRRVELHLGARTLPLFRWEEHRLFDRPDCRQQASKRGES